MRIALIVTSPMSANLFLSGIARHLSSEGHSVFVICGGDFAKVNVPHSSNVKVLTFKMNRNPSIFNDLVSFWNMFITLRSIKADLAIYATPKASFLASIATFLLRVPVRIYALWGLRFETARGISRFVLQSIERATCYFSTSVLANSFSIAEKAISSSIVSEEKISVLGAGSSHGVDLAKFNRSDLSKILDPESKLFLESNDGITLGFVGRIHPDKGINTLFDSAQQVLKDGTPIKLLLVGPKEGFQFESKWETIPVRFVGETDDVSPYIKSMDVLVLMSLREGFPNVVLEAAALEVPSIVSNATGCIDSVIDGQTGLIVPVGNLDGLSNAIKKLSTDAELRAKLGINARNWVTKEFDQEIVFKNLVDYIMKRTKNKK